MTLRKKLRNRQRSLLEQAAFQALALEEERGGELGGSFHLAAASQGFRNNHG
jgi:hypothetical protein